MLIKTLAFVKQAHRIVLIENCKHDSRRHSFVYLNITLLMVIELVFINVNDDMMILSFI